MSSIADVAAAAGVSQTTVSHVLSGKRKVSTQLTEAVHEAIKKVGYLPSRAAQNLATGSTRMIALVVPDISNSFFAELARGVESAAQSAGFSVLLANTGFDHSQEQFHLEVIASRAVDGVVYAAGKPPKADALHRILGMLPTVLVDEDISDSGFDSVVSENEKGGTLMAQHLLGFGHQTCLLIDAPAAPISSEQRTAGFAKVWENAGAQKWVVSGDFTFSGGEEAMKAALPLLIRQGITSVFALNDLMALGAISELRRANLRVPEDVSVTGFDNTFAAQVSSPGLTTVSQDVAALGQLAVGRLLARVEDRSLPQQQQSLPVKLISRDSVAQAQSLPKLNNEK